MKALNKLALIFIVTAGLFACESRSTNSSQGLSNSDNNDTIRVTRRETKVSRELDDFRAWVNSKANKTENNAKENWPQVKEEFKEKSARLDAKADSLSAETKAEYAKLKAKYKRWESQQDQRQGTPLDPAKIQQWQQELLGGNRDLASISGADMRETYLLFMGIVRAKNNKWTQDDWDYVDYVYGQLNDRKQQVESGIPATHRIKIKALQAEYLALESSSDARDLYQHVKK
ncbi:hypothetical protein [Adhaeribacter aquaticus]|uniref:hypothetical protein n=1 Tax=Adhaeribacter aquaticus TaxID=299567 RepID=UPI0003FABF0A|nr:hypothetical protein [Adhaeribacter aquaticus]